MKLRKLYVDLSCALIALCALPSAFAQSFEKGNQEYVAGRFQKAISEYEALVQNREYSPNLFYNLGNAYFRVGDFGGAILNYERALALDRHHPEAQANLQIARDEARALELVPSTTERIFQFASQNQYAIAAAIAFWIGVFCMAGVLFSRRRLSGVIALSILSLSISAVSVFTAYWIDNGNRGRVLAIVTVNGTEARLATAENANSVLALPPGSEIKILSKRGDWIYATLPNNLRGWIPAKSAEQVRL
jgi:tetratricopeptide (TPR) repeat protein